MYLPETGGGGGGLIYTAVLNQPPKRQKETPLPHEPTP